VTVTQNVRRYSWSYELPFLLSLTGFEEEEDPSARSFFSEIISSISDVKFSHDGRYILSRDYLSLKIWDINMESRPIKTIPIHDHLRGKLCDLYENDCIFDKFECNWGGDDKCVPFFRPIYITFDLAYLGTSSPDRTITSSEYLTRRRLVMLSSKLTSLRLKRKRWVDRYRTRMG